MPDLSWSRALGGPTFDPHSPQAAAITRLFDSTLVLSGALFLIVVVLIGICAVRFRARDPNAKAVPQTEGQRALEIGWTVVPLGLVAWLLVLTTRAMGSADPPIDRAPDLTVIGHQWWWEVRYASGVVTANELHIPTGKALVVQVDTADVIHDFWVPSLGRKMDAIPGRHASIWLQADAPGTYLGTCAEFCGVQHAWMRLRVVAEPPAQFAAWERDQLAMPESPVAEAALRGAQTFSARSCVACHAIAGVGDAGFGPDLTHLAARETLGAGVIPNTPTELGRWLMNPQAIKPGCHMPNAQLSTAETADLVAYFETLR